MTPIVTSKLQKMINVMEGRVDMGSLDIILISDKKNFASDKEKDGFDNIIRTTAGDIFLIENDWTILKHPFVISKQLCFQRPNTLLLKDFVQSML